MKIIDGEYHYQVSDLLSDLKDFPQDSIVFVVSSSKEDFLERSVYKTVESADPGEVYLYLGGVKKETT